MSALSLIIVATRLASGTPEPDALEATALSVRVDGRAQMVRYEVTFNREPDFHTLDESGAQADSFQFHLDTMEGNRGLGGTSPYPWESVVRGEEIHVSHTIRIRDHVLGPSHEPGSGGWGPIAGAFPYRLQGRRLTFSIPFAAQNTPTGRFAYSLELYRYGSWTGRAYGGDSE